MITDGFSGQEDKNVELKIKHFGLDQQQEVACLMVNACISRDYTDAIVGVCFVGEDITYEKVVCEKEAFERVVVILLLKMVISRET